MENPPPALRPMEDFDPVQPAILHDRLTNTIVTWTGEDAAGFRRRAQVREPGLIEFDQWVFDGWGNVLGG
jgi:hypothetical protein